MRLIYRLLLCLAVLDLLAALLFSAPIPRPRPTASSSPPLAVRWACGEPVGLYRSPRAYRSHWRCEFKANGRWWGSYGDGCLLGFWERMGNDCLLWCWLEGDQQRQRCYRVCVSVGSVYFDGDDWSPVGAGPAN